MIHLKLTVHFQGRMPERGIDIDHVKQAIERPDEKIESGEDKIKVKKRVGEKMITVVYFERKFRDEYIVVTAYYN